LSCALEHRPKQKVLLVIIPQSRIFYQYGDQHGGQDVASMAAGVHHLPAGRSSSERA